MLEVRGLKKRYGDKVAVDGVGFSIGPGQSVGLLGPNGAGKTTTVSIISGLLVPDEGEVLFEGARIASDTDPRKKALGLVPQELALYDELSAKKNLALFGALYGLGGRALDDAIKSALEVVGLADRATDPPHKFSGGMKRRLNLAAALLSKPKLLLLDEPTVGVDPQSRNAIFDNLEALKAQGMALLYTTHYMEEAERLCDRIVIIDHGHVVADDTLRGLHGRIAQKRALKIELEPPAQAAALVEQVRALAGVSTAKANGDALELETTSVEAAIRVLTWLSSQGHRCSHFETHRPNLEDVFLTLTGRTLRDA